LSNYKKIGVVKWPEKYDAMQTKILRKVTETFNRWPQWYRSGL